MSTPDAAAEPLRQDPAAEPADAVGEAMSGASITGDAGAATADASNADQASPDAPSAETTESADDAEHADDAEPVRTPIVETMQREVTLQRAVRYDRVIIGATVLGALLGALACLFFPVEEGAEYTMAQAVGFMLLIGGAIGLGAGGIIALILGRVVRRRRGGGIAIQADVR